MTVESSLLAGAGATGAELLPGISPAVYGRADFARISALVEHEAGIMLPPGKAMLVYSRIAPLVRDSGCGTFANYLALVEADPVEKSRVVVALTTNHTFFYREAHHFEHFADVVRPDLVARLAAGQKVRMWSAGCSNGDETWSLVMTLLGSDRGAGRRIAGGDLAILASDLAPHALAKASAATYTAEEFRPVPAPLREAWTEGRDDAMTLTETARALVRFRQLNLLHEWPMRGRFDVIFCRNVMIYFDNPVKDRLVERFADVLAPGGYLYIGHSERVTGPAAGRLDPVGPTIYRRTA